MLLKYTYLNDFNELTRLSINNLWGKCLRNKRLSSHCHSKIIAQYNNYMHNKLSSVACNGQQAFLEAKFCSIAVVVQAPVLTAYNRGFREIPMPTTCPGCGASIITRTEFEAGVLTWILCIVIFTFGLHHLMSKLVIPNITLFTYYKFLIQTFSGMLPDSILYKQSQGCYTHLPQLPMCGCQVQQNMKQDVTSRTCRQL